MPLMRQRPAVPDGSGISNSPVLERQLTRRWRSPVKAIEIRRKHLHEKIRIVTHRKHVFHNDRDIEQCLSVLPDVLELIGLALFRRDVSQAPLHVVAGSVERYLPGMRD